MSISVRGVAKDQGEEDVQRQRAEGGFKCTRVPDGRADRRVPVYDSKIGTIAGAATAATATTTKNTRNSNDNNSNINNTNHEKRQRQQQQQ